VPAKLAHPLSPGVAAEDAVLTEPAAVVYQALGRTTVASGIRALVVGDGTIALLAAAPLRLWSPAEIVLLVGLPPHGATVPRRWTTPSTTT
jgi:threonine dehydrogenase-like Zn-dependent dehydrogenase